MQLQIFFYQRVELRLKHVLDTLNIIWGHVENVLEASEKKCDQKSDKK